MTQISTRSLGSVACIALGLVLIGTGCGKSMVLGGGVATELNPAGDQIAEVFLELSTGQTVYPDIELPIFDPTNPSVNYGSVKIHPKSAGVAEVRVGVNLTTTAQLPNGDPVLPNGSPIPVVGAQNGRVISIPVPNTRFVIYVAANVYISTPGVAPVAMIGAALPFTQFDPIGQAGPTNLFLTFNLPQGILGTAGVFGGPVSGTSGIGLFVDVSGLIQDLAPPSPAMTTMGPPLVLNYNDVNPSSRERKRIERELNRMSQNRVQLTLQ